ncbi:unnamed protein product [Choristocarpus tenellus]
MWWIKSVLSDQQKANRLGFAISHMDRRVEPGILVDDLYDWVYVDENWFYILKGGQGVYLCPTTVRE